MICFSEKEAKKLSIRVAFFVRGVDIKTSHYQANFERTEGPFLRVMHIRYLLIYWSKTLWASYCRSTKRQQGSRRTEHADYDILQTGVLRSVSIHTLETRSLSIIGTDGIFCRECTGFECLFKTD